MKQAELYLWYLLFQAQWDICDQQNHKILNIVAGHYLYSENRFGGVMMSVVASSAIDSVVSNQRLLNWYLLLIS